MWFYTMNARQIGQRRSRAAFTLIELLVVVAIIALLMSILLPSMSKARESARCVKCSTNLRSILQGSLSYLSTYGRFVQPQLFPQQIGDEEFDQSGNMLRGEGTLAGGERSGVWDCPNAVKLRSIWTDPVRQDWMARYEFISYGANDWGSGEAITDSTLTWPWLGLLENLGDWKNGEWDDRKLWGIRESMVAQPAKFICFSESNRDGIWDQVIAPCMKDWCWGTETPGVSHVKNAVWGVNVGLFDGHVQWYGTFTYPEWEFTKSQRQVTGIMIGDGPKRFYPDNVRDSWRMMWNRDYKPHLTSN
jgi:prepilin-type N-terminal cleavage/methylation domain-containing protein